jgi:heme exporter protein C
MRTTNASVAQVTVTSTGTRATRVIGIVALVGLAWLVAFGLVISPPDEVQGDAVRLMYVHVPSAWLAYLSFGVTALGSVMYLWKRTRSLTWDRIAGASAEIGVLFTALALVTGMIWGRLTWGFYWTWDARLTSTALMFLLYVGYLAMRRTDDNPEQRARRAAWVGVFAVVVVPIVHNSVNWWRTLHQKPTVLRRDAQIDGLMLFSLFVGMVAFTLVYVWLLLHKQRVLVMEDALAEHGLDVAIAERNAEGLDLAGPPDGAVAR